MTMVGIISKQEFQGGMATSLVYHDDVIYVTEVRRMYIVQ